MQMPTGVVFRRTANLVPYANNARTHTPEQVKQIAASVREFGFAKLVLISSTTTLIAGQGPRAREAAPSASTRYRVSSEEGFDLSLMGLG